MPPLVHLQGLARRYPGGTLALADLDLSIATGSFISLLGPSGCGKSTVLRLLAGLDQPSAGRIDWAQPQVRTGFVFQEPTLMPWSRVAANVGLPLQLAGVPRAQRATRVNAALQAVGLAAFERAYPHELSGGMKMRVSIARALVTQPDLLLFDEPFAALDEITRFGLQQDLLAQWQERRFTAVFVTHSISEAVFLSQQVVVMGQRPGRVVDSINLPFAAPHPSGLRHSAAFADVCGRVAQSMERAHA